MPTSSTRRSRRNTDSLAALAAIPSTAKLAAKLAKLIVAKERAGEHMGGLAGLKRHLERLAYEAECARSARRGRSPRAARSVLSALLDGSIELRSGRPVVA